MNILFIAFLEDLRGQTFAARADYSSHRICVKSFSSKSRRRYFKRFRIEHIQHVVLSPKLATGGRRSAFNYLVKTCFLAHNFYTLLKRIPTLKVLVIKMKTAELEDLTNAAMSLPEEQRAKLAHDLVASLDGATDYSSLEAWDFEICRRIKDLESGRVELIDADEAVAQARARLRG